MTRTQERVGYLVEAHWRSDGHKRGEFPSGSSSGTGQLEESRSDSDTHVVSGGKHFGVPVSVDSARQWPVSTDISGISSSTPGPVYHLPGRPTTKYEGKDILKDDRKQVSAPVDSSGSLGTRHVHAKREERIRDDKGSEGKLPVFLIDCILNELIYCHDCALCIRSLRLFSSFLCLQFV